MVKRWTLAGTLLLAGCTMIQTTGNRGVLLLKPQITAGNYGTQTQVAPYTQASIDHLILNLFTFDGAEHDQGISKTIYNADLARSITFSNLRPNITYRIKASAYSSASLLISTTASDSYTDVTLSNDDRPTIANLKVKLIDQPFNGQATSSGVVVANGGYLSAGPEAIRFNDQEVVTTLAGQTGVIGSTNGTGLAAQFHSPFGLAVDSGGNLYIGDEDNHLIRKITSSGIVSTLAGQANVAGYADGAGTSAKLNLPLGVAVDGAGNVYVADYGNHLIRKVTSSGIVSTLAGGGGGTNAGYADGQGTTAKFNYPVGIAVDGGGNVYVADRDNNLIRKITSAGLVSTLAGGGGNTTAGYTDGTGTAAKLNYPYGVAVDGSGNVYVADRSNNLIRKITSSGVVSTIAGGAGNTTAGYADGMGTAAKFNGPCGVAVDVSRNIYVADRYNNLIRKITSGGVVLTLAGGAGSTTAGSADGTGTAAQFSSPIGIAVDGSGVVYIDDWTNQLIRVLK